jgi:hypothetical protein
MERAWAFETSLSYHNTTRYHDPEDLDLKMEVAQTSEKLVSYHNSAQSHNPEVLDLENHRRESLRKSIRCEMNKIGELKEFYI